MCFHMKILNFETPQFWKDPHFGRVGSQEPFIFRASGNPEIAVLSKTKHAIFNLYTQSISVGHSLK